MKNYQNNMADQDLVVHSLKVLTDFDSGTTKQIKHSVDMLQKQTQVFNKRQEDYWSELSADGIISAVEKQGLYREMLNIEKSYASITLQAQTLGYSGRVLQDYIDTYTELRTYLFDTLKLFDDMAKDTPIADREVFNSYFSGYYYDENFLLLAITAGVLESVNIRVLSNLQEEGTEGESALYHGGLYQYVDGRWKAISTGNYKGAKDELPAAEEESFFLASDTFYFTDVLGVYSSSWEELYVNGDALGVTRTFLKGTIYYVQDGSWYPEEDHRNWRYAAAFADVINVTGELPQIFQDAIDDLQTQINTKSSQQSLDEEIAARQGQFTIINGDVVQINSRLTALLNENGYIKMNHLPQYLGAGSITPTGAKEGDFFVWTGSTLGDRENSKVYVYRSGQWVGLDPNYTENRNYYMMALTDVLAANTAGTGYFSALFANAFFSNAATISNLQTRTISLQSGGNIKSADIEYTPETRGFKFDSSGNSDWNGNTHLGGKVAIGVPLSGNTDFNSYDVVIGGNTKIAGTLAGAGGTFNGEVKVSQVPNTDKFRVVIDANGIKGAYNVQAGDYLFKVNNDGSIAIGGYATTSALNNLDNATLQMNRTVGNLATTSRGFLVTNEGQLLSTGATIYGDIYAENGYFKGNITGAHGKLGEVTSDNFHTENYNNETANGVFVGIENNEDIIKAGKAKILYLEAWDWQGLENNKIYLRNTHLVGEVLNDRIFRATTTQRLINYLSNNNREDYWVPCTGVIKNNTVTHVMKSGNRLYWLEEHGEIYDDSFNYISDADVNVYFLRVWSQGAPS